MKTVPEGDYIGYGCTYRAMTDLQIAVLPVGYFEGYRELLEIEEGSPCFNPREAMSILGRICMNMMMVNISHLNDVHAGEKVTLIGQDELEEVTAETIAGWSETIHYEIFTCLNPKIPRVVT